MIECPDRPDARINDESAEYKMRFSATIEIAGAPEWIESGEIEYRCEAMYERIDKALQPLRDLGFTTDIAKGGFIDVY